MKHRRLLAVAHNYAHSLACGLGFVIGYFPTDIFGEAKDCFDRRIDVDILAGQVHAEASSRDLRKAVEAYAAGFAEFCERNQSQKTDFAEFRVRYFLVPTGRRFTVFVQDRCGKLSAREYEAWPGRRVKVLDPLGRLRPKSFLPPREKP